MAIGTEGSGAVGNGDERLIAVGNGNGRLRRGRRQGRKAPTRAATGTEDAALPYSLDFRLSTMLMRVSLGIISSMEIIENTMVTTKAHTKLGVWMVRPNIT